MSLYVEESGVADAPGIVFIHAVSVSGWMWNAQIAALNTDFHCLNVDLPGHGQSNSVKWVSLEDSADQIAEIIRTRAHDGKANVVGLSLGSYVGLTLLSRHPDLVLRVVVSGVTAAPLPNLWTYSLLGPVMALAMKTDYFIKMNAKGLNIPAEQLADYGRVARMTSRQAFIKASDDAARFSLPQNLAAIPVPTLIVAGEDEHPLVKAALPTIAATLPNGKGALVPGVGHGWSAEKPAIVHGYAAGMVYRSAAATEIKHHDSLKSLEVLEHPPRILNLKDLGTNTRMFMTNAQLQIVFTSVKIDVIENGKRFVRRVNMTTFIDTREQPQAPENQPRWLTKAWLEPRFVVVTLLAILLSIAGGARWSARNSDRRCWA